MIDDQLQLRVALGDAREVLHAAAQKHHRDACLLGRRPEPVRGPVAEPSRRDRRERKPNAEHIALLLPGWDLGAHIRIIEMDAAHDPEAIRIFHHRLRGIVVTLALPARRNEHHARHASLVHHRPQPLETKRFRHLRCRVGRPGPLGRARLPDMHLRVDEDAARRRLRGARPGTRRSECKTSGQSIAEDRAA